MRLVPAGAYRGSSALPALEGRVAELAGGCEAAIDDLGDDGLFGVEDSADLRHEGTSRLFEAGFTIEQVALVTGHKDWKMLRRHTHLKPETLHDTRTRQAA